MTMTKVEIDVPEEIVPYTVLEDKDAQITRNAMLVYPYIKSGVMSHGKAAEMLGLHKIDLITLYGKLGLPYFDETEEEFEEEIKIIGEAYQIEPDQVKETLPESSIKQIREDLAVRKAAEFARDSAIEE